MSLRIPRLTTRSVARTTRLFFTPTANQTLTRPLLTRTPLRRFAFYRRSVRAEDVLVVSADKIPRLPVGSINREQEQYLWVQLREGLGEDEYKDVAARVEIHVTDAVAAAYARSRAHRQQDTASGSAASQTISAISIDLIYKPPHPIFPGLQGTAAINLRVLLNDGDVFPLLFELRHADDRIKFVFVQPEIFDAGLSSPAPGAGE
ncbi:hypothetical protein D0866_08976 [Hortaea werneckii]|uniref:Uncharacterized protein n=1 Tax=Hortaea werneckii TaxID=91943 RepID=A0A3M7ANA4_HORWE|nr:hypothetical protein D0866_08976 [Hortaea werneckii]